jgi:hypothetical protein
MAADSRCAQLLLRVRDAVGLFCSNNLVVQRRSTLGWVSVLTQCASFALGHQYTFVPS